MASKPTYLVVTESFAGDLFEFHKGEVVDADDPAAKKWPSHFGPLVVRSYGGVIEQATAAPGEKRNAAPPPDPELQGKAMTLAGMKGQG
jgi:hypothetical protein